MMDSPEEKRSNNKDENHEDSGNQSITDTSSCNNAHHQQEEGSECIKINKQNNFQNDIQPSTKSVINHPSCDSTVMKTKKMDELLSICCQWSSSALLTDRGFKLAQWSVWLLSQWTKNKQNYHKDTSSTLRKVYSDLSMMRYVLRFYGMPVAIEGVLHKSWAGGEWKDKRIHSLANIMAWSMVFYHPLEHIAWAKWNMPSLLPKRIDANKYSAWSCRFWLLYIISDWISSILKNKELRMRKQLLMNDSNNQDTTDHNVENEIKKLDKTIRMNRIQMIRCAFFTPPCLTWSLPLWASDPLMSENYVNGFSLLEAIVCIHQSLLSLRP